MPRCADPDCGRWRPELIGPRWATGIRFNGHWYCSRDCVEHAAHAGLDTPVVPAAPVGSAAAAAAGRAAAPPRRDLRAGAQLALESQRESGLRLGAELQRREMVASEPILKSLAAQGGVSYLATFDVRRVTDGPAWLPAETVRALGVVPFDLDESQRKHQGRLLGSRAARGDAGAAEADRLERRAVSDRRRGLGSRAARVSPVAR